MATIVLCHGAWSAAWAWRRMRPLFADAGHVFHAPTCTGLGERAHLAGPDVDLETHIADILGVIETEELTGITLLGHSYGGMVITGVADRIPGRIAALVYLDAFLPQDGQSLFDINVPANTQRFLANAGAIGGLAVPAPPAAFFNVNAADAARVDELATPHPLGAFTEKIRLTGAHEQVARHIYVHGTVLPRASPFAPFYARVRDDPAWEAHTLACGHHVMLDEPERVTDILERAARP